MLTSGDVIFKSMNSTSMVNFPVNGTSIAQTKSSLFLSRLSVISAFIYMIKLVEQNMKGKRKKGPKKKGDF
jgi:hypothetical protein